MPEPSKWALLIGIDRYHESLGSLKYAGADCRALRETLVSGPLGFPEDQLLLLDDAEEPERRPTFANIHNTLGTWLAAPKPDDLVVVYFAGHGRLVDGKTYLVPGDATLASIHTLGIPLPQVQDVLERCKARRKLLVLDACHSGSGRDVAAMPDGMAAALAAGTGFYTISSCGAEERSHEWDEVGHGVFSHFLTEALRGGCSPAADGRLTVDGVYEWVHDRVAKWAAQHRCAQTPQRFAQGAGTLVISQSAPDYAALAEQYRREAEEARSRLAEDELRELHARIKKNTMRANGVSSAEAAPSKTTRQTFAFLRFKVRFFWRRLRDWLLEGLILAPIAAVIIAFLLLMWFKYQNDLRIQTAIDGKLSSVYSALSENDLSQAERHADELLLLRGITDKHRQAVELLKTQLRNHRVAQRNLQPYAIGTELFIFDEDNRDEPRLVYNFDNNIVTSLLSPDRARIAVMTQSEGLIRSRTFYVIGKDGAGLFRIDVSGSGVLSGWQGNSTVIIGGREYDLP